MSDPAFTIILPTYQRREDICLALDALFRLEYAGVLEIIVVVDGSTDGTLEALDRLRRRYPLTVIAQQNRGLASARNRGARSARGEILLFLDDDMVAQADLVAQHAAMYLAGADAVHGSIPLHEDCPRNFLTEGIAAWAGCPPDGPAQGPTRSPFELYGGHFSVRRDVFERLGGFDEVFTADGGYGSEDADFAARLLERYCVSYNRNAVSRHRFTVEPSQVLKRAARAGRAHVVFAHCHPAHLQELLARIEAGKPSNRLLYRPLARLPFLPALLTKAAVAASTRALARSQRSGGLPARLFHAARQVNYWAGVRAEGGFPQSTKAST